MGDSQGVGQDDERPAHTVRLDHFSVGKYPLTVGELRRFIEATGYKTEAEREGGAWVWNRGDSGNKEDASWRNPYMEQDDRHPVVCISWNDAQAYCKWLSKETGQAYGLLTEAQWEYACRADSETAYCFGDDGSGLEEYAWFGDGSESGSTHPVGEKKANDWQIHDMHGNQWEWCADWYAEDYYEQLASAARSGASEDPIGPESGPVRVVRGGSWYGGADECRSACRGGSDPGDRILNLGFRLSRTGPLQSYPFTLGRRRAEERAATASAQLELEKPRYVPHQGFRDALPGGGEAPEMVYLPGGSFVMGDEKGGDNEKPVHAVRLDAFAMGRTPVTVAEYLGFCEETGEHWPEWLEEGRQYHQEKGSDDYYRERGVSREAEDLPIVGISWEDASAYCDWLSEKTGETYTLPTEAQWEFACRADSRTRYCFGDDEKDLGAYAWYAASSKSKLHPVGEKQANEWNLHDMHGNLWEWCADWYAINYYEELARATRSGAASRNPSGPETGSFRVVRGGSWLNDAVDCRSAFRSRRGPGDRYGYLGFRLSRTV
jgi:formylglycine-generating enzyme required for sulfatase activity